MNPIIKDYLTVAAKSVIVAVFGIIAAWLSKHGVAIPDMSDAVLTAIATSIIAGVLMLLSRLSWRKWFATAQAMDKGVTENQVAAAVAAGQAPVATPSDQSPKLTATTPIP